MHRKTLGLHLSFASPKQSIGIRKKLPYIPRVKDQDINKVALIAGVLMIVIVVTTQWENIASLIKSPEPLKPVQAQANQNNPVTLVRTNNPPPHGKLVWPPDARPYDERIANGEKLSMQFCGTCHVRPKPDVLTQANWERRYPMRTATKQRANVH